MKAAGESVAVVYVEGCVPVIGRSSADDEGGGGDRGQGCGGGEMSASVS